MEDDYKEGRQLPGRRCVSLEAAVGYLHSPTPLFFLSIFGFLVAWEWELDVGPAFFFLFLIHLLADDNFFLVTFCRRTLLTQLTDRF